MPADPPHVITLPILAPQGNDLQAAPPDAEEIVSRWLVDLEEVLKARSFGHLASLFRPDCWWRDHLALSWDLRTLKDLGLVEVYLKKQLDGDRHQLFNLKPRLSGKYKPELKTPNERTQWIESMFDFETNVGRGSGVIRLARDGTSGRWKCYLISTSLLEIKGAEERIGQRRPYGGDNSLTSLPGQDFKGNWQDHRQRQKEFVDSDPIVLVVGAGQAGLCVAARLEQMGLPTLIIDKNERIGDNWRQRYRTLVLHDPVHICHLPYIPFPINWPLFCPKDKVGDWFENYADMMELNVWTSTMIKTSSFDSATKTWTVELQKRDGTIRTVRPHHVVFCTGHSSEPKMPTFANQSAFKGLIYHASQHRDASELFPSSDPLSRKKVVVIGTGNSGHDIAQNFHEAGAGSVTLLQRSPTLVISSKIGYADMKKDSFTLVPLPAAIEDADVYDESKPVPVRFAENVYTTATYAAWEQTPLHDPLRARGFALTAAPAGAGLFRKYITDGGGYYIDVGCSALIIDGRVRFVRSERGIRAFTEHGLILADDAGTLLDADVVVCATGYANMRATAARVMGPKVDIANRTSDVWDLDAEGEVRAMWRPSGHPRFWYMGGNLGLCRHYSKVLALQIVGVERGLNYTQ